MRTVHLFVLYVKTHIDVCYCAGVELMKIAIQSGGSGIRVVWSLLGDEQCMCVQSLLLCLNSGSASFSLKASYFTTPCEGIPRSPQMRHSSLFLEDSPLLSLVASRIPRFFECPKKKKEREKMATSRGIESHFHGPGWQKL